MIQQLLGQFSRFRRDHALGWLIVPFGVAALMAVLSTLAVARIGFFADADRFVQDSEIARRPYGEPQDPNIVIAAITEDTLHGFQYRQPIDRGFLDTLLQALAAKGPRAIGIDILFDQPTETDKDAALRKTLQELRVPLVVSYAGRGLETPAQLDYLDHFVPRDARALANIATDQTDTVRWIYPGEPGGLMSFARALAAKVGVPSKDQQIPIVWHRSPERDIPAFKEYPAHTVPFLPAAWFKGKIVLIGTDITLDDRHRTPFATVRGDRDPTMAGVVIQAHALSQLLDGKSSPRVVWWIDLLIAFGAGLVGAALGTFSVSLWWRAAGLILAIVAGWFFSAYTLFYQAQIMIGLIAPTLSSAAAFAAMESLSGRDARRQREFIHGAFSRYVSPKLVERLVRNPERMKLEGERREMTFLFTDVKDFTTMSEKLESHDLAHILNAYLEGITAIVLGRDGMVDKFIGDAVFAIFNAPVDLPDHADKAVHAALEIDRFCQEFHETQVRAGIPFGITRIGVHTGTAVIGNFGSSARFTYTALGDAVNTASRLEALNKHFGTRIAVSEATVAQCKTVRFRPIASVVLKGKSEAVAVYEALHEGDGSEDFMERYAAAFAQLEGRAPGALALFDQLTQEAPDDPCVALHLDRLRRGDHGTTVTMTEK
jgi:class 3 adenylate cyclase/CHASE2 domain-containing sensor protein